MIHLAWLHAPQSLNKLYVTVKKTPMTNPISVKWQHSGNRPPGKKRAHGLPDRIALQNKHPLNSIIEALLTGPYYHGSDDRLPERLVNL